MKATNREILELTVARSRVAWDRDIADRRPQESSWGFYFVEPILEVLGWPRLPNDTSSRDGGTGAYFEWPGKHTADVALLDRGSPKAFGELKDTKQRAVEDLSKRLRLLPVLGSCRVAFAGWFEGSGGLAVFDMENGPPRQIGSDVVLAANGELALLASLARPVLLDGITTLDWLEAATAVSATAEPRFSLRATQDHFFERLRVEFGATSPLPLRERPVSPKSRQISLTYAHTDIPGLARGWGLTYNLDVCINQLSCLFYEGSDNHSDKLAVREDFGLRPGLDDIDAFLEDRVLPAVASHRPHAPS